MATTKNKPATTDAYMALIQRVPLRPIRTDAEHKSAAAMLHELMMRPDDSLDDGETDYLTVLGKLIHEHEVAKFPPKPGSAAERLQFLVGENEMTQADVAKLLGVGQPAVSLILSGKRSIPREAITRLAERFNVHVAYFI